MALLLICTGSALALEKTMGAPMTGGPDPYKVLTILEKAVSRQNFEEYRSVLADSFVYVPDVATAAMYPHIDWAHWGIAEEEIFLRRLLKPVLKAELRLTDEINEQGMPIDKTARYVITYLLKIEGKAFISEGTFTFVESDQRWYLWKWEETAQVTNPNGSGFFSNSGEVRAATYR